MVLVLGRRSLVLAVLAILAVGMVLGRAPWREEPVPEHIAVAARTEMPVFYVKTDQKAVALTFDISWGHRTLPLVLPILREHGVKATFFLSGPWARRYPEFVRQIVADGHEIASHGDKHVNLSQYSKEDVRENISKAHQDLKETSGRDARFFRPPNGDYDDVVIQTARELGYETVIWSVDSLDWKNPGVEYMINRVVNQATNGSIILMHASDSCQQTHLALPGIISGLRQRGFRLVTLGELAQMGTLARDDPRR